MPTTAVLLLPYPATTDPADVPADVKKLADRVEAVRGAANGLASTDAAGKIPAAQLPSGIYVPLSAVGNASGVAALDADGKVPIAELPAGVANGVASLGGTAKVPIAQLPSGTANGVASLDAGTKVPVAQLPTAVANGVASLDAGTKVPVSQLPDLSGTYQPRSEEGAANGYASLDSGGKVPVAQLPSIGVQVVSTLAAAISGPGAQALVQVVNAYGDVERVLVIYDATINRWVGAGVYHSDYNFNQNAVGWDQVGYGRRFTYGAFVNAGLKPQVRMTCHATDISSDQNAAEVRIQASGDNLVRGSGGVVPHGLTQVAYDGRYNINYGGSCAFDTGWANVYPTVGNANMLVVQPAIATNDSNGHPANFRGIVFMLRWVGI